MILPVLCVAVTADRLRRRNRATSAYQKVDTVGMRFRATLASIGIIMILAVSSAGPSCAIKCDLTSKASGCHAAAHASPRLDDGHTRAMAGMTHHPAAERTVVQDTSDHWHTAGCRNHICTQLPAVLQEHRCALARAPLSADAQCADPIQSAVVLAGVGRLGPRPPPQHPATPVALRTSLRV